MLRTLPAALLVVALLAGCVDSEPEPEHDGPVADPGADHNLEPEHIENETIWTPVLGFQAAIAPNSTNATFVAAVLACADQDDHAAGNASFDGATFACPGGADSNASALDSFTYRLEFGDGNETSGTDADFPLNITYGYAAGNHSAALEVTFADGAGLFGAIDLAITAVEEAAPAPDYPLVLDFGATSGRCAADVIAEINSLGGPPLPPNCIDFFAGPGDNGIDGHWLQLDPAHVGRSFTSTLIGYEPLPEIGGGDDSDCVFTPDDHITILGEANNGGGVCEGTVPEGATLMFIYPWASPADGGQVLFD